MGRQTWLGICSLIGVLSTIVLQPASGASHKAWRGRRQYAVKPHALNEDGVQEAYVDNVYGAPADWSRKMGAVIGAEEDQMEGPEEEDMQHEKGPDSEESFRLQNEEAAQELEMLKKSEAQMAAQQQQEQGSESEGSFRLQNEESAQELEMLKQKEAEISAQQQQQQPALRATSTTATAPASATTPPINVHSPEVVRPSETDIQSKLNHTEECADVREAYEEFLREKPDYDRSLRSPEQRCQFFKQSIEYVNQFNKSRPDAPFLVALNNVSDWTPAEKEVLRGIRDPGPVDTRGSVDLNKVDVRSFPTAQALQTSPTHTTTHSGVRTLHIRNIERRTVVLPETVDYRDADLNPYGVVATTSVKDQGRVCGACWAFVAASVVEGQLALATGSSRSLSPQELIDCDGQSDGCNGGKTDSGLSYVAANGISASVAYPFTAVKGTCRNDTLTYATAQNYTRLKPCDEEQLMEALYYLGPISVYVKSDCAPFMAYSAGVLDMDCLDGDHNETTCSSSVDHAMLLVGYGTDQATGLDYWLLKNTWSVNYGESGYMRIKRGSGQCGTSCIAAYPVVGGKAALGNDTAVSMYGHADQDTDPAKDGFPQGAGEVESYEQDKSHLADTATDVAQKIIQQGKKHGKTFIKRVNEDPYLALLLIGSVLLLLLSCCCWCFCMGGTRRDDRRKKPLAEDKDQPLSSS